MLGAIASGPGLNDKVGGTICWSAIFYHKHYSAVLGFFDQDHEFIILVTYFELTNSSLLS